MAEMRSTSVHLLLILYHISVLIVYIVSLTYDGLYVTSKIRQTFAGRWKFLTFINEILQTLYFAVALLNDVFGSEVGPNEAGKKRSSLQKMRDIILSGMAFPMGSFVVTSFWGIYLYDRELVFPKVLDKIIPAWLNHIMHTTVIVFLLIELYVVNHKYPGRKSGLAICIGFASVYQIWLFWIAFYANIWVYPVLAVLSWPGRIGFCAVCWVLVLGFYLLGEGLNRKLWGVSPKSEVKKMA